uniref:SAM domain-containing protein n=1 Tax=Malurus cyaneus samueli TaxID=2593467 RepID=A0A8C5UG48_9PASS
MVMPFLILSLHTSVGAAITWGWNFLYQSFPQGRNGFKVGMKLEGVDPEHPSRFCVLTVAEVVGYRMRLHFDGYPECYDFWANADSSDIHPVGWCEKTSHKLLPPKGFKEGEFNWTSYLKNCKAQAAPKSLFKTLSSPVTPSGFRLGMKLEAVDKKNPSLICVATIMDMVENRLLIHFDNWDESYDYWCETSSPYIRPVGYCQETGTPLITPPGMLKRPPHGFQVNTKLEAVDRRNPILIRVATIVDKDNHRIKIHFDGWDHHYDFWVDADSPDIHPVGWCDKTGHTLQVPLVGQACPTPGCQGIGHVRGPRYGTHYTLVGCPYSDVNLSRENLLQDRLMCHAVAVPGSAHPSLLSPPGCDPSSCFVLVAPTWSLALTRLLSFPGPDLDLQQALHQSIFMPSLASNPTHRLHLFWEQHCRLLPEVSGLTAKQVAKWTVEEVVTFIQRLPGCKEQASVFREEQIDGEAFLLLKQNDIVKILSIKLGPALKIYNAILMFKSQEELTGNKPPVLRGIQGSIGGAAEARRKF